MRSAAAARPLAALAAAAAGGNKLAKVLGNTGLMALCAAAGVVRGVADPLFFEMTAEVARLSFHTLFSSTFSVVRSRVP